MRFRTQACDVELESNMGRMAQKADPESLEPCPRDKRARGNVPENFDLRKEVYRVTGVDLTKVNGINVLTAQTTLACESAFWPR